MPTRIAFLNTHPIQYYAPLYAHLNRADDLEITALYLTDLSLRGQMDPGFGRDVVWDIDLLAGYEAVFVGEAAHTRERGGFFSIVAPELRGILRRRRFDALVVQGHNYLAHHLATLTARGIGTKLFARGDTHGGLAKHGLRGALRRFVIQKHYALVDGCLAVGSWNAEHYRMMGVPESKLFHVPFCVDNARFASASALSSDERDAIRRDWGVDDDRPVVLFAGKLIPRKRAGDAVEAIRLLASQDVAAHLVIVGTGELETGLRAAAEGLPVSFAGFANQSELPRYFGAADLFCFPSDREPWGLVLNEAMAAGLPVVVAENVGAARDLVHEGQNGYTFKEGDVGAMADAIRQICSDRARRNEMAAASRTIIEDWSFDTAEAGLRNALEAVGLKG